MKQVVINKCSEIDRTVHARIIKVFKATFCACDFDHFSQLLHPRGVFFGGLSKEKAVGTFYKILFSKEGPSACSQIDVNYGISFDHEPGQFVIEFRCSNYIPLENGIYKKRQFGEEIDPSIEDSIYRFALTFKDAKIYTIRIPNKVQGNVDYLIANN